MNWNRKLAARRLNICYKSLLNKLRRWQLRGRSEVTANRDVSEDVYTISATGSRN